jgi:hypothetical protein
MRQPKAVSVEWSLIKVPGAVIAAHLVALLGWAAVWLARG